MIVGVPKEIKESEYRTSLVAAGAEALTEAGHMVLIEAGAGEGTGITDEEYREHGRRGSGRRRSAGRPPPASGGC